MPWLPLILFAVVVVAWLSFRLLKANDSQRKSTQLLNTKQKYLSAVTFALFVLSLLIVPWRVDAQLLAFPIFSHISYGLAWHPPSGGINQAWLELLPLKKAFCSVGCWRSGSFFYFYIVVFFWHSRIPTQMD
jgi:hypothetical protein